MINGRSARVLAPAKINLGLELLGKRPDGYHEIRTIMAMTDFADEIRISPSTVDEIVMNPDLGGEQNLVGVARDRFTRVPAISCGVRIDVTKHIPIAGGLGGASVDAAATLLALNALRPVDSKHTQLALHEIAASIGSDVPFFLGSPIALASGTGTDITPLPPLPTSLHAVLVSPQVDLPRKTATLYQMIQPSDFTDGTRTASLVESIRDHSLLAFDGELLANPFRTAWIRLGDPLAPFEAAMLRAGAPWVALSGAGPTIYTLVSEAEQASELADDLRALLPQNVAVHDALIRRTGIVVELDGEP